MQTPKHPAITIRAARPEDAEGISRVRNAAKRATTVEHRAPENIVPCSGFCTPEAVRNCLSPGRVGFVAVADQEIVGFALLDGDMVHGVCVHPDHAGAGLGKALLNVIEQEACRRGVCSLRLGASLNAKPFYASSGFHVVRASSSQVPLDADVPCMEMEKIIAS